jgi:hypothetical protein
MQDFCIKSLEMSKIKVKQVWLLLELQNMNFSIIQNVVRCLTSIEKFLM